MTYGTHKQSNVHYINLAEDVMDALSGSAMPVSGLVDVIPWILPILAPIWRGMPFNKTPAQWKELVRQFRDEPFLETKKLAVGFSVTSRRHLKADLRGKFTGRG